MRSRFVSNLLVLVVGALLMADRFLFGPGTAHWLGFGAGCFIVCVVGVAFLVRGRGSLQRILDLIMALAGGWMVLAALAYDPGSAGWIALGAGGTAALAALAGLVAHEALMERAVTEPARAEPVAPQHPAHAAGDGDGQQPAAMALASWPS